MKRIQRLVVTATLIALTGTPACSNAPTADPPTTTTIVPTTTATTTTTVPTTTTTVGAVAEAIAVVDAAAVVEAVAVAEAAADRAVAEAVAAEAAADAVAEAASRASQSARAAAFSADRAVEVAARIATETDPYGPFSIAEVSLRGYTGDGGANADADQAGAWANEATEAEAVAVYQVFFRRGGWSYIGETGRTLGERFTMNG